ncbi:MAG TPA: hypothetical protein VI072_06845 [Polyangiaceae bacterium]
MIDHRCEDAKRAPPLTRDKRGVIRITRVQLDTIEQAFDALYH